MLIEFRFRNFLSFETEQVLSMVASADKEMLDENTVQPPQLGKKRLLRSAAIYGANASGKTNIVNAFAFLTHFVQYSADEKPDTKIRVVPFLLDESTATAPAEVEISFIHEGTRYQFGFRVDRDKVHEEWLTAYPKGFPQRWYHRSADQESGTYHWDFGSQLKGEKSRIGDMTRPNALFLSVAAKFNHKQLLDPYEWLVKKLHTLDADDEWLRGVTASKVCESTAFLEGVRSLLSISDTGIVNVSVREMDIPPDKIPEELRLRVHKGEVKLHGYDVMAYHRAKGGQREEVALPLGAESRGTQRLFSIGGPWLESLEQGYTLVVDELDSSLHPLLSRKLVEMFHDPAVNLRNAQLVFNTHDTTLLDSCLLRRDQVWFVEKSTDGASHLYPLLDFSPRKDEALGKGYLRGRYGAIPVLGDWRLPAESSTNGED